MTDLKTPTLSDLEQIPVDAGHLRQMRDLLESIIRKAGQKESVELVELSERCKALVDDMIRVRTH